MVAVWKITVYQVFIYRTSTVNNKVCEQRCDCICKTLWLVEIKEHVDVDVPFIIQNLLIVIFNS